MRPQEAKIKETPEQKAAKIMDTFNAAYTALLEDMRSQAAAGRLDEETLVKVQEQVDSISRSVESDVLPLVKQRSENAGPLCIVKIADVVRIDHTDLPYIRQYYKFKKDDMISRTGVRGFYNPSLAQDVLEELRPFIHVLVRKKLEEIRGWKPPFWATNNRTFVQTQD